MVQFDIEGREAPPMPEREFSWPVYDIFNTADNRQLFIGAVTDRQWELLCLAVGLDELLDDPELQTKMDQIDARDRTLPIFAKAIAARSFDELVSSFEARGIPFSPINRPAEMYADPHVMRPEDCTSPTYPKGGTFRAPGLPVEIDGNIPTPETLDIAGCRGRYSQRTFSSRIFETEILAASGRGGEVAA